MAGLLDLAFSGKVTVDEITTWLSKGVCSPALEAVVPNRAEFVPYLLNFLRDQSAPILQGCRSANATPSKTPTVLKTQRAITFGDSAAKTSTPRQNVTPAESKRVQLFAASPLEGDSLTHPIAFSQSSAQNDSSMNCPSFNSSRSVLESPGNTSWSFNSSQVAESSHPAALHSPVLGSGGISGSTITSPTPHHHRIGTSSRRHARTTPDGGSTSQRRPRNNSMSSPTRDHYHNRSQHKHSLGEYLVVSSGRRKKSPSGGGGAVKKDDHQNQSLNAGSNITGGSVGGGSVGGGSASRPTSKGRPPGGGHSAENSDKSRWAHHPVNTLQQSQTDDSAPKYALSNTSDFPSLAPMASVSEEPQSESNPPGTTIITPSRRINPQVILSTPRKSTKSPSERLKTPKSTSSKVTKTPGSHPRRITPTAVTPKGSISSVTVVPVFQSQSTTAEEIQTNEAFTVPPKGEVISMEEERKLLREARSSNKTSLSLTTPDETTPQKASRLRDMLIKQFTPTKLLMEKMAAATDFTPDLSAVTFQSKLDILVSLYVFCIKDYLVPNVNVELYFVVQLLTTRGLDAELAADYLNQDDDEDTCYLASIHNAVYFAVSVLEKQINLLSLLDKGTLRLMVDNPRIAHFSESLQGDLLTALEQTQAKARTLPPSSPVLGVSFQADTDNRKNFPSDRAFHTFKKQRDQFYELLREWQENHMQPCWSIRDALGDRIRLLVGSHIDLTSHVHFTRLFQSQLILMCKGDHSFKQEGDDENISLLSELKQTNPDKFKRLQERFITPQSVGSPCPQPGFPGCQEFFRDFVVVASSFLFNHHLMHTFAEKITDLDSTQFTAPEGNSDQETETDPEDLEALTTSLLTLRLLGKFLGFVTFLPYQSPERLPDTMEAAVISMRNKAPLPLDLINLLRVAKTNGTTVLTVPWVVEVLSMMDSLAPRLDYIQEVLTLLVQIYRSVCLEFAERRQSLTFLLIVSVLGWLFELPIFPEGMFFKTALSAPAESSCETSLPYDCLDFMDLVDHNLYYTSCPYAAEVKSLLMGFAVGSNNKGSSIRKITPLMTNSEVPGTMSDRQLQLQLEENFFHNHPASLKRTVEFVADRVSSNYIKKFRAGHLPKLLQDGVFKVKDIIQGLGRNFDTRAKRKARQQVEDLSLELATNAHKLSCSEITNYALEKSAAILPLLLPEETSTQVIQVSTEISSRLAQDKVVTWMTTHITKAMFLHEFSPELERHLKLLASSEFTEPPSSGLSLTGQATPVTPVHTGTPAGVYRKAQNRAKGGGQVNAFAITHDETGPFPSEILVEFKEVLRGLVSEETNMSTDDLVHQLKQIKWCIEKRQDVISNGLRCMAYMTTDLAYTLVLRYPRLWTQAVREVLIDIWSNHLAKYTNFKNIICQKHMSLLATSSDYQWAWESIYGLIIILLKHNLLTSGDLAQASSKLLPITHSERMFVQLADFINKLALHCHEEGVKTEAHYSAAPFLPVLEEICKGCAEDTTRILVFRTTMTKVMGDQNNGLVPQPVIDPVLQCNRGEGAIDEDKVFEGSKCTQPSTSCRIVSPEEHKVLDKENHPPIRTYSNVGGNNADTSLNHNPQQNVNSSGDAHDIKESVFQDVKGLDGRELMGGSDAENTLKCKGQHHITTSDNAHDIKEALLEGIKELDEREFEEVCVSTGKREGVDGGGFNCVNREKAGSIHEHCLREYTVVNENEAEKGASEIPKLPVDVEKCNNNITDVTEGKFNARKSGDCHRNLEPETLSSYACDQDCDNESTKDTK